MSFWQNRKVLVTGGAGFIGSRVVENLIRKRKIDPNKIFVPRSKDCDLRAFENCQHAVEGCEVVLHLAARTGGIAYSRNHPATQYYDCSLINLHMLEAARQAGVKQFVALGNILAYPAKASSPLEEDVLHEGKVAETHLGIGVAKRNLVLMAEMYKREFDMSVVVVLSANAYGPSDRFDPTISHVIPATIAKCFENKDLVVWGDGTPTRDFLYVEDVAEGLILAAERLRGPEYVNIASGQEISIKDLVYLIAKLTTFQGKIIFDASKSGGDPKRGASGMKAKELMEFKPKYTLEEGLHRTIHWFIENKEQALEKMRGHC